MVANVSELFVYAVSVCPVRQFNVQLSVEKVFIAQKTSEDRVWKGKAAGKDAELVGYGKGTGEGEWMGV